MAAPIAGCVSASRSAPAWGSENTMSRRAGRSRCPSGVRILGPKRSTRRSSGGCPGSTTSRATWSLSRIGPPKAPKTFAAVDLPLAIPPVSPTRYTRALIRACSPVAGKQAGIACRQTRSGHQRQPPGKCEERAERDGSRAVLTPHGDEGDSDQGASGSGDQDDRQQHLPAEPRAQRGKQLEVTVPHAFLTRDQPEQMIDAPQARVTGYCTDQTRAHVHRNRHAAWVRAEQTQEESAPQQRQREIVRQQLVIDIDEGEGNEEPGENHRCQRRRSETELPGHASAEQRGERLYRRIANRDGRAAAYAAPSQNEPGQQRNVPPRADGGFAGRAGRARHDEVEGFERAHRQRHRRRIRMRDLRALLTPLPLEHDRQTVDDHVEETADRKAEDHTGANEQGGRAG